MSKHNERLPQSTEEKVVLAREMSQIKTIITLTERQLSDLEQIIIGGFAPLTGFMTEIEYNSVVDTMRLPDGSIFPIPVTLDVEGEQVQIGEKVVLADVYGNHIALLEVTSLYAPDKVRESTMVFGTTDDLHPGVQLVNASRTYRVGGPITGLAIPARHDFADLRKTPNQLKEIFAKIAKPVVAFQTRNPLHRAHYELITRAAEQTGAHILLHPVVGPTKEGDIDYVTRVRAYKRLHEARMKDRATVALLQLAMRMGGPREALWHAIIRKNYGATHFIIGRDHAGPGNDKNGNPFYDPMAAQELAKAHERDLGITIVALPEMVYSVEEDRYMPQAAVQPGHTIGKISGTKFRQMLRGSEEVPSWFSFPEVIDELRRGHARKSAQSGITIFFTGLSGAGKSTTAMVLRSKLLELQDRSVSLLDGDIVRRHLSKGLGFSREDRDTNVERIGYVASEITRHGGIAICSAISPFKDARDKNRELIEQYGTYIEVFVSTPLAECAKRDPKGIYKKALAGTMKGVTGVDDPYEAPQNPEITIDTSTMTPVESADVIVKYLRDAELL